MKMLTFFVVMKILTISSQHEVKHKKLKFDKFVFVLMKNPQKILAMSSQNNRIRK